MDPETGRPTRTLLLSATPYRMYTTADEPEGDHYADFVSTCSFLFRDDARVRELQDASTRCATRSPPPGHSTTPERICADIGSDLRSVMARTERLAATPDRDGMLAEHDALVPVKPDDLRAYLRLRRHRRSVEHHEPTEYWKAGPYLVNFMERYKLKEAFDRAALTARCRRGARARAWSAELGRR